MLYIYVSCLYLSLVLRWYTDLLCLYIPLLYYKLDIAVLRLLNMIGSYTPLLYVHVSYFEAGIATDGLHSYVEATVK